MDNDFQGLNEISEGLLSCGGTSFLPTTLTSSIEALNYVARVITQMEEEVLATGVLGGTNLAMVIETALLKDGLQIDGLRDLAINTGKEAIKGFQKSERPRFKESGI
ncbi:hypothetical protein [Bacillus sp. AFS031507]|uniref:hypothetical protein n=1 Tax=Bacillus sp. AFS031507 TaxID=2033496 RepID=UPI00211DB01E|nr:hypothetical protein [Bacillus sp. AFS031507]